MFRIRTIALATFAIAFALVVGTASAHVTAQPPNQTAGAFSKITFRVPNERPEATIKIAVQIPEGATYVSVQPTPGWTSKMTTVKLDEPVKTDHGDEITERVSEVTWTGGTVKEGEFQEFSVSMKLPEEGDLGDLLFFPAVQTYEGGEVVSWIEKPASADDDAELERPAPKVTLEPASGDEHGSTTTASSDEDMADMSKYATESHLHKHLDKIYPLAIAGVVLGLLGLIFGFTAFLRTRKP